MVAYSFKAQFAEPILSGAKRQTVRAIGKRRHAEPGERVQLYVGMRTKHCRKIITPDPICSTRQFVEIEIDRHAAEIITGLKLDGRDQAPHLIERFAMADGFGPSGLGEGQTARRAMGEFWVRNHMSAGEKNLSFFGFVIRWRQDA